MNLSRTLLLLAVLVPSVILHEVAHGVVASWFGDDTARRAGRLTLNPLPHVDLFGTLLLPAMLALTSAGVVFGYAKPVPVNRANLRRPRDHGLLVSLAGPATNIILAVAAALVLRFSLQPDTRLALDWSVVGVATAVGFINVLLAGFNLIPLPPLDGSAVIERFLPESVLPAWHQLRRWSMLLVLGLVFFTEIPAQVFDAALGLWWRLV